MHPWKLPVRYTSSPRKNGFVRWESNARGQPLVQRPEITILSGLEPLSITG